MALAGSKDGLRQALARQVELYEQFLSISRRQLELARSGDLDLLDPILDEKDALLREIEQVGTQLKRHGSEVALPRTQDKDPPSDEVRELTQRSQKLLESIVALEEDGQEILRTSGRRLAKQLSQLGSARGAMGSYGKRPSVGPRLLDRKT
jgi:hypothetical protein